MNAPERKPLNHNNVMKYILRLLVIMLTLFSATKTNAQCANDNVLTAGSLTPVTLNVPVGQTITAGQYMLAFVQAGASYTITTCSSTSSFDSQITVYNDLTGAFIVYNDDFCGLLSSVSFTPTFCGYVRVLVDRFFCTTTADTWLVEMTQTSPGAGLPSLTASADISACNNSTVQIGINGNGTGGTLPYTYSWLPVTNLATPTQPQSTATVTATTSYTLTLTDANGCLDSDTVDVTLLPNPVVNLGPDTIACGTSLLLDAGNPGNNYLWSTGNGTQTLTVTQPGSYSVSVLTPQGCIGSDNVVVGFVPNPTVNVSDTVSCSSAVLLDAGSGFSNYVWSTGDTTSTSTATSSGSYAVTVTDSNNCSTTDSVLVTLSPAPTVNLGPAVTQCGDTVVLDAGNPGMNYIWSNQSSNQTTNITQTGVNVVSVIVISSAGCYGYDTVTVTINNQPDADLGPDTSICTSTITLDAGNPGSSYAWSGGSNPTSQINTLGNGTFTVTVTDPSGCADSDTITVATNVPPVVSAGANVSICPGQTVTLTATGAATYVWSDGNIGATNTVSPSTTTTYYVTGTNTAGCTDADVVTVNVNPSATAGFTASVVGSSAVTNNTSTGAASYQWNFGDNTPSDNSANPVHTYTANGTYTITLIVTGICGSDTMTQVVTITQVGLQDIDLSNTLEVYPNPNDGVFTIAFELSSAKTVQIEVLDVQGRKVVEQRLESVLVHREQLDLSGSESGIYVLRIITTDGVATQKIVVRH
jgi:Secretion system C-terminal sorting domain/PKD domain